MAMAWLRGFLHLPTASNNKCSRKVFSDIPSPSQAFEADLAHSLQKLLSIEAQHPNESSTPQFVSLSWLCSAMDMVMSTQASMKQVILCRPASAGLESTHYAMVQQYTVDSVKLLDVCVLLKEAMGGMESYVNAAENALKHVQLGSSCKQDRAFVRTNEGAHEGCNVRQLAACSSMLGRMAHKLKPEYRNHNTLHNDQISALPAALYGGEIATIFVLRLLATALSNPRPAARQARSGLSSNLAPLRVSGQPAWERPLLSLQAQLRGAQNKRNLHRYSGDLPELHKLDASLQQMGELMRGQRKTMSAEDELRHLADATRKMAHEVRTSVARLHHQIDSTYSSLMDSRMALLDLLTRAHIPTDVSSPSLL